MTLNAVVGVVLHVGSRHSILPELLSRRGPCPAVHPRDRQALKTGIIYVAPPDRHMLFNAAEVHLSHGPRENHARPALDPLFRSAALEWRERVIGVVLTGDLDDGTAGLAALKACGGIAIVQDPATAFEPSMPSNALANVAIDECLPLSDIAPALARLVGAPCHADPVPPRELVREHAIFEGKQPMENLSAVATPSTLTCPDCGGGLWEMTVPGRCATAATRVTVSVPRAWKTRRPAWPSTPCGAAFGLCRNAKYCCGGWPAWPRQPATRPRPRPESARRTGCAIRSSC